MPVIFVRNLSSILAAVLVAIFALALTVPSSLAQQLAKRLVLRDGSYQLATNWEVKGDRVRYLSAERNEWEELPYSLIDWAATEKFEKDRSAGTPSPEAIEVDKELAAERAAEEARNPQIAPGLRLPEDGLVVLLDTFQNQPELVELQQSGGEVNRNRKQNVLRAAINPVASSKQTIELDGPHAMIQAHTASPSVYVNLTQPEDSSAGPQQAQKPQQPELPWDRFRVVRLRAKGDKRIVGDVKTNVVGKVRQEQTLVPTSSQQLTGGWVKVTPTSALEPGEYAVLELLGNEGINTFVWDFGVNPSAPANSGAVKPQPSPAPRPDKPKDLQQQRKPES